MRFFFVIILTFVFPLIGQAEPGSIRAGEHATFSRLVIDVPIDANWKLSRIPEGYLLDVPGVKSFDTTDVFSRLPSTRIDGLPTQSDSGEMQIQLNCECHAKAFQWRDDKIVVDIVDGVAPAESPFEIVEIVPVSEPVLPIIVPISAEPSRQILPHFSQENEVPRNEMGNALNDLQKIVVEGLALGAAQGLLTPSENLEMHSAGDGISHGMIGDHIDQNQPGLLAHTSLEFGSNPLPDEGAETGIECLPKNYFSVGEWVSGSDLFETIGPLRANLTDELFNVSHETINDLSRAYLSFGFGREAIEVLKLDNEMTRQRKSLVAIALIIDDEPQSSDILDNQISCENDAALWAFVVNSKNNTRNIDTNTILATFRNLPTVLQSQLSPRLAKRFMDIGDYESAEMAVSIDEFVPNDSASAKLVKLGLHSNLGEDEMAIEEATNLLEASSRMTPEEYIEYMKFALNEEQPIAPEVIDLADILRFENSGSEWSGPLATIQVRALLVTNAPKKALELLAEEEAVFLPEDLVQLRSEAVLDGTEIFSDSAFLEMAFSKEIESTVPLALNSVSRRLLTMNLPERAGQLLEGPAIGEDMIERRYLRAQAAIELGDSQTALDAIAGMTSAKAIELRLHAEQLVSVPENVAQSSVGNNWRMGNWGALSQGDDDLLKTVSLAVLEEELPSTDTSAPLTQGRGLLEKSQQTRMLITEVLDRFGTIVE